MQKTITYLNTLLKSNDKIVIGLSGGSDSMCLLHILNSLKEKYKLQIIAAHINHNKRSVSKDEELFVKEYCAKNDILFETMSINSYEKGNFQDIARTKRYVFFEKLVKKYKAEYLMTAHHGDDLIETILMRITRGATLRGYAGIDILTCRDNYKIVKPLLFATKEEILAYLDKYNIKYCTDASNLEDHYTRNRYRHHILPFLKEEDKNVHEKFLKFHNVIEEHDNYFKRIVKKEMSKLYIDNKLDLNKLKKLDKLIQIKIIEEVFHNIYNDDLYLITDEHLKLILNLIKKPGNTSVMLPDNKEALKTYDTLVIKKRKPKETAYNIKLNKEIILPNKKKISLVDSCNLTNNYCSRINSKEVKLPLYVRSRQVGDRMQIKNMVSEKKVKDIFINEKITREDRDIWPVVVDADNKIIWLPGLKKSKFDKDIKETYDIILVFN